MTATHTTATPQQLSRAWRDWTEIVRLFAEKASAREQIKEKVYGEIHKELTALLNGLAEQQNATDSRFGDLCDQLNELVRPWMTLSALRDVDPRISQNLLVQCQNCQSQIDAEMEPSGERLRRGEPASGETPAIEIPRPLARSRSAWSVAVVCALLFIGMFAVGLGSEFWSDIRQSTFASGLTDSAGSGWRGISVDDADVQFWVITGVITVITAGVAWTVFCPPRSY